MIQDYLKLAEKYKTNFNYVKGHTIYMSKGVEGAPKLRDQISKTQNIKEIKEIIQPI